jgi:hypothetical protein
VGGNVGAVTGGKPLRLVGLDGAHATPPGPTTITVGFPSTPVVVTEVVVVNVWNWLSVVGVNVINAVLWPFDAVSVWTVLVGRLTREVAEGPTDAGVQPGAAGVPEGAEVVVDGESGDEPGCRVSVTP